MRFALSRKNIIAITFVLFGVVGLFITFYETDVKMFTVQQLFGIIATVLGVTAIARSVQYAKFNTSFNKGIPPEYLSVMEKLREIFLCSTGFVFVMMGGLLTFTLYYFQALAYSEFLATYFILTAGYDTANISQKKPQGEPI